MADTVPTPKCTTCQSNDSVIKIVYGKPGPGLIKLADEGKVKLGGCCPKDLRWRCKTCEHSF